MTRHVLYISFDGILEPIGESQVLNYLVEMKQQQPDLHLVLLSFEKRKDLEHLAHRARVAKRAATADIQWRFLSYHYRPRLLASFFDFLSGFFCAYRIAKKHDMQIIHTRSFMASLIGAALQRLLHIKWVFDIRGFWVEEKVDGGAWTRNSWKHRLFGAVERWMTRKADHIVTLTNSSLFYLPKTSTVIPTCVDLKRFQIDPEKNWPLFIGYLGSVSFSYDFAPSLRVIELLSQYRPDSEFLILNRDQPDRVRRRLESHGLSRICQVKSVHFNEVPGELRRLRGAIYFLKQTFAKTASCPTKLGELLAMGIPILTNSGIGDIDEILSVHRAGISIPDFSDGSLEKGARDFLSLLEESDIASRCRRTALQIFSLEKGASHYLEVYKNLSSQNVHEGHA